MIINIEALWNKKNISYIVHSIVFAKNELDNKTRCYYFE